MPMRGGETMVAKLGRIARNSSTNKKLRVGFPPDMVYPDGTPVAQVAATQNWGAPMANIPPRPFFTNAVEANKPSWSGFMAGMKKEEYNANERMAELGEVVVEQIRAEIEDGDFVPLAESTIVKKGSDQPLINKEYMLKTVSWWLEE